MKQLIVSVCTLVALGWGTEMARAAESMMDNEAKPTIGERLSNDTVEGTLMKINGESYWVKDMNGKEIQLHVDSNTKRDKVIPGDTVTAYVMGNGHTITLHRAK